VRRDRAVDTVSPTAATLAINTARPRVLRSSPTASATVTETIDSAAPWASAVDHGERVGAAFSRRDGCIGVIMPFRRRQR
jgi:hypothetical protein